MGERANIIVRVGQNPDLYLYTHWGGYELPDTLREALARGQRWNDPPYLARIIFSTMVRGKENEATGFGISTSLCDNSYPFLVVRFPKAGGEARIEVYRALNEPPVRTYSLSEYVALPIVAADPWTAILGESVA